MPRGDEVVVVTHLLIEGTKLNQAVAHHVRIRRKTSLHLLHRITGYLVPIFMMTVNHLQLAPILSSHSRSHLQVLLRRAVPLLFLLRTNLDVEAIRDAGPAGQTPKPQPNCRRLPKGARQFSYPLFRQYSAYSFLFIIIRLQNYEKN